MIKVSVIVPVYKVPLNYLRECFNSLLAQTMQECEFIIVSDGAPEAECSVCDEYAAKDSRFKFFRREHAGVSATRNFGISQAQGEYITFVDSDDWIDPSTLELCYTNAIEYSSQIILFDYSTHTEKKTIIANFEYQKKSKSKFSNNERQQYIKHIIWPYKQNVLAPALVACKLISSALIKKNNIQFNPLVKIGEDRLFNHAIASSASNISYIKKNLYHYRQCQNSAMHSFKCNLLREHLTYIKEIKKLDDQANNTELANETMRCYYHCLAMIYYSNLRRKEIKSEFHNIKTLIHTQTFLQLIKGFNGQKHNLLEKIEYVLIKNKINIILSLRYIYYWIFRCHH